RVALAVRILQALPAVDGRDVAAVQAAAGLEGDAEGGGAQACGEARARMLLQPGGAAFNGSSVVRAEAEVPHHRHDARAHRPHRAGTAQDVDVVAGGLLDDLEVALALPDELSHESKRAGMQKAAAERERRAAWHLGD